MRLSEHYNLGRQQPELEFVDVDIQGDTKAFVDPSAFRSIDSDWGRECIALLQNFFTAILQAIQANNHKRARELLASLSEPNETRLGLSRGVAQGRGMGRDLAREVWKALQTSNAVQTGLLQDLEDTILFIDGIGYDIISDITTNIIREPLIEFTQTAARYYGIPLTSDVVSGRMWNRKAGTWMQRYVELPTAPGRVLFVPKSIVRRVTSFSPGEYYNDFIVPFLQDEEMRAKSSLVQVLKKGGVRVTKKSIKDKYGEGKAVNLSVTLRDPALLDRYRAQKRRPRTQPGHREIAALTDTPPPDWDGLLAAVRNVPPGAAAADTYHRAVEALLTTLFFPALDFPVREFNIHEGRKRIDVQYTNVAAQGFFYWLHAAQQVLSGQISVECKNYGAEIGNPELDQLAGRFSPLRGRVGFLCHRGYGDKARVVARCRDTALDDRGFIVALDDDDLAALVDYRKGQPDGIEFPLLFERFRELL